MEIQTRTVNSEFKLIAWNIKEKKVTETIERLKEEGFKEVDPEISDRWLGLYSNKRFVILLEHVM